MKGAPELQLLFALLISVHLCYGSIVDYIRNNGSVHCHIKNVFYHEYLYAGSWFHKDIAGLRHVMTYSDKATDQSSDWLIKPLGEYFTIQNPYYYNEYLTTIWTKSVRTIAQKRLGNGTAPEPAWYGLPLWSGPQRNGTQKHILNGTTWDLKPVGESGNFKIVNIKPQSNYHNLCVGEEFEAAYRRLVYVDDASKTEQDVWKLYCEQVYQYL